MSKLSFVKALGDISDVTTATSITEENISKVFLAERTTAILLLRVGEPVTGFPVETKSGVAFRISANDHRKAAEILLGAE